MNSMQVWTKVFTRRWVCTIWVLLGLGQFPANGQSEYDKWAERVNWDGITPWQFYIIASPGFMGPNALPIPKLQKGRVENEIAWEIRPEYYFGGGDKTFDMFTRIYLPFAHGRIAVEGTMVVREWYQMTPETRDKRRARTESGKGAANGDIYISTLIQIWKDKGKWPDGTFSINLKTAPGEQLSDARHNDAGGYYFDISLGKDIRLGKNTQLRWHTAVGFYVWQVYSRLQQQNDAISFGAGLDLRYKNWYVEQSFSGYAGYIDNGDKPMVYIAKSGIRVKRWEINAQYKKGFYDFPYQHISLGLVKYFRGKRIPSPQHPPKG